MDLLTTALTAFILIVPVELPDKTFIATLMLATRYPPLAVWCGVLVAFFVQCVVAVAAGRVVTLLPHDAVQWAVTALFAFGAVLLFQAARQHHRVLDAEEVTVPEETRTGVRAAAASFVVLFAAEWGDLSQLLTAGLAARGGNPIAVFLGSWLGLATVSGAAVLLGRWLMRRVRPYIVSYIAAAICAVLAVITALSAA